MVPENTKGKFKKRLLGIAEKIREEFGIDPLLCVTQAAHESNWGESQLAKAANNLFGMTVTPGWRESGREVYPIQTKEYHDLPPEKIKYWNVPGDIIDKRPDGKGGSILVVRVDFRKYKNWDESVADWATKLSLEPRYQNAVFHAKLGQAQEFFNALHSALYATDPKYAEKLMAVYKVASELPNEDNTTIV